MSIEWFKRVYVYTKPFILMILLQASYAVYGLVVKSALNKGLNHYSFSVYRNAYAALFLGPFAFFLERNVRPKMTTSIFLKIMLLGLLGPVIDQNLFFAGLDLTTTTFAMAMRNIVPAITFVMAWIFRLETVKMKCLHIGKIIGTLVTVGGGMIMTLIRGPSIQLPWTNHHTLHHQTSVNSTASTKDQIKGSLMITAGCFSWASFVIVQALTLKCYPAELSLTTLLCMIGALEGAVLAVVAERANASIWSINWDIKLFATIYSGIMCSGCAYSISGIVMRERGPVFVTAFNPLGMVFMAILGSSILGEKLNLGSVLGAVVIVVGLYVVLWGKNKDQNLQDQESSIDPQHSDGMKKLMLKHKHNVVESSEEKSSNHESV
ncbi:putative EamA domain-containing protein [Helianthus annuus]|nr:putative EamA domain-containing protein [Helianthus annuus]KAJ0897294.1 putative EamA domain-containing protein [Helianthus annuus]KAJ0901125.1 putative EamA domain-containing protein [Helianthus annuus]